MGSNQHGAWAGGGGGATPPTLRRRKAADEELDRQSWKAWLEVGPEFLQVLASQDLGRSHDDRLHPGGVDHRSGRRCHGRLPRTDTAAATEGPRISLSDRL